MISIDKEKRNYLIKEIQSYFDNEREVEFGIIASEDILDFFMEKLGKDIYNVALADAKKFMEEKIEMIESDFTILYKD